MNGVRASVRERVGLAAGGGTTTLTGQAAVMLSRHEQAQADAEQVSSETKPMAGEANEEAEVSQAADRGDACAFADLRDAPAGGKDQRDDGGETCARGGESGECPVWGMDQ